MLGLTLLILSNKHLVYLDEFISFSLLGIALFDCLFNGNFKRYRLLWLIMAIISFYAVYSILFLNYNTPAYILKDWVIELKPYIPFCVFFAIGPQFTEADKKYIRIICIVNAIIIGISFLIGSSAIKLLMSHHSYACQYAFICGLFYFYCSRNADTGIITKRDTLITIILISIGLMGFKAKYYAAYIPALYLLTLYKPGVMRNFTLKHALAMTILVCGIAGASWSKFQYYFLQGNSESFDPSVIESYARPVLYVTGSQILADHFPFGTGLASFASSASSESYSNVYFEYGIQNVHGISMRSEVSFITDAFYPSLAQFGVVGLILFIAFWFYIYSFLRILVRTNPDLYRAQFICGSLIIIFILAESAAATTFTHDSGMITMSLLGMACAYGKRQSDTSRTEQLSILNNIRKI